jgi:hypothetical protein
MGRRNTLTVSGLTDQDSFHYHWFNDIEDRLTRAQEAGYVFVDKFGKSVGDTTVDSARGTDTLMRKGVGQGVVSFLMKIPMEFYTEDQARKQREISEQEQAMQTNEVDGRRGRYGSMEIGRK